MLESLQLEARYFSSAIRLMSVQSKSMKKKQKIKAEKAGMIHFLTLTNCFYINNVYPIPILQFNLRLAGHWIMHIQASFVLGKYILVDLAKS